MFSGATTLLTVLSVVLHAVLGCCAHHQHACTDSQNMSGQVSTARSNSGGEPQSSAAQVQACCHRHVHQAAEPPVPAVPQTPENKNSAPDNHTHGSCGDDCAWALNTNLTPERNGIQDSCGPACDGLTLAVATASATAQRACQPRHTTALCRKPLRATTQVWRL